MPKAEIILWSRLRRKQLLGERFRRQYSVDSYVLDFCCPELKLAIEVDGESHTPARRAYDEERQAFIEAYGVTFLRFTNADVYENLDGVLMTVHHTIESLTQRTRQK
jgi:very-short-patch-repair endonuclease